MSFNIDKIKTKFGYFSDFSRTLSKENKKYGIVQYCCKRNLSKWKRRFYFSVGKINTIVQIQYWNSELEFYKGFILPF